MCPFTNRDELYLHCVPGMYMWLHPFETIGCNYSSTPYVPRHFGLIAVSFRIWMTNFIPLRWRHSGRVGVSNHQLHDCLLNHSFRRRSKKTSKPRVTGLCAGNSPVPGNSPHKWPVTRKMLLFDDVIMPYKKDAITYPGIITVDPYQQKEPWRPIS